MELMKLRKVLSSVAVIAIAISASACGPNLAQTLAQSTAQSGSTGTSNGSNNGQAATDPYAGIVTEGSASNMMGKQSFNIDKANQLLRVAFDLPINLGGGSMHFNVSEIPGAFVGIDPDPVTGKWVMSFNIPLSSLVKGVGIVGPTTLPNGQALPGVPGGEPPRIAAHITRGNVNLYVYASVKYFGLFVPTPGFNPYFDFSFPIKNSDQTKILGYFSTVSAKGGFDGGVFLSIVFPPELAKVLDNLFS